MLHGMLRTAPRAAIISHAMSQLHPHTVPAVHFYATAPYPCSYLPHKQARSQVATPSHQVDARTYTVLVAAGFRRSGSFTYRPYCDSCNACVPVRIPVDRFTPSRTQRKTWRRHASLQAHEVDLVWSDEHYDLYRRYQSNRHPGGGMDDDNREQYEQFLLASCVDTRLVEFRDPAGVLRMVSIIDVLTDGLSSMYTFYDPDFRGSLGTWNILWQAARCQTLGLHWLYLGYWIAESRKMAYKASFRPLEVLYDGQWRELTQTPLARAIPATAASC